MDTELARTFLAIVETGTFNRAAEQINVTQSTVSTRVRTLESLLGQPVFQRSKAGATLTPAGAQFRRYAENLVRTWQQARQEVGLSARFDGLLAVGGQFTLWDRLMVRWIPWMRAAVPDLAIRAEVGLSEGLMRMLLDGQIDIAVLYTPHNRPGFVIEELLDEQLVLVATDPASRAPHADDYVYVDWGPEFQISHGTAFSGLEATSLWISHGPLGLQHILGNGGAGYFPRRLVRSHVEAGRLFILKDRPSFSRPAYMVHPEDRDDARFQTALQGLRYVAATVTEG
ncbi:MAG: LysR family transcriptional regulator [Rhodobacterales bacterium]|nr:LysR family transcriptional regulator [Rhodobacterales bacterium]